MFIDGHGENLDKIMFTEKLKPLVVIEGLLAWDFFVVHLANSVPTLHPRIQWDQARDGLQSEQCCTPAAGAGKTRKPNS